MKDNPAMQKTEVRSKARRVREDAEGCALAINFMIHHNPPGQCKPLELRDFLLEKGRSVWHVELILKAITISGAIEKTGIRNDTYYALTKIGQTLYSAYL